MLPTTSNFLTKYNIKADKKHGQNFLLDPNICAKIVSFCGDLNEKNIVEIGPGPGSLTQHFFKSDFNKLILIEQDIRFLPILDEISEFYNMSRKVNIINNDALKINLDDEMQGEKYVIISNLPYHISTSLLFYWTENMENFSHMILMFQREVAERIIASPFSKEYGRISVIMQYMFNIENLYNLAPHYFTPSPKVYSTILRFRPKENIDRLFFNKLNKVLKLAFAHRRKILVSNLRNTYDNIEKIFDNLGINPKARAEELDLTQFLELTKIIEK